MAKARVAHPPEVSQAGPFWWVYVLRCRDGTLYCGVTTDVERRLAEHNRGNGARYTRARIPVCLEGAWSVPSRSEALKAEWAFKKLSRPQKMVRLKRISHANPTVGLARRKKEAASE